MPLPEQILGVSTSWALVVIPLLAIEPHQSTKLDQIVIAYLYKNHSQSILCPREHGELLTTVKHDNDQWYMIYNTI
jgi:hypothetical protein